MIEKACDCVDLFSYFYSVRVVGNYVGTSESEIKAIKIFFKGKSIFLPNALDVLLVVEGITF